jgi:hypothetical protein
MRTLFTDIGLAALLASTIIWFQLQPIAPISLDLQEVDGTSLSLSEKAIVLFWNVNVKASHRDIQLIQRFHQAHPDIQTVFIHDDSKDDNSLRNFLINLGVYSTPIYNSVWPEQIPTTILLNGSTRVDFSHSPHYSKLMEFFEVEF